MPLTRIGIAGWTYTPWRGPFFPEGLPQNKELAYASRQVNSIEINGTFYSLQRPNSFRAWHDATPDDFVFSVKAPRFITHIRRLKDVATPVANFFASGLLALNEKLGPILWQLPPTMKFDAALMEPFLAALPHDTAAALKLAKTHDERMKGRAWLEIDENRPLRHALEVRHETFEDATLIRMLRKHNVALVIADAAKKFPMLEDVTADFVYLRLHGASKLYVSGYSDAAIKKWADKIAAWQKGGEPAKPHKALNVKPPKAKERDAYVYFDNTEKVHAPANAMRLAKRLKAKPARPLGMEC